MSAPPPPGRAIASGGAPAGAAMSPARRKWLLLEAMRTRWNAWFRGAGGAAELPPNELLVAAVRGRAPGEALDVGVGQGRNALYLASLGWKVTGVDVAEAGLDIAERNAAARGLALQTMLGDASAFDWGAERWDLIALVYEGRDFFAQAARALRPGGIVVVEHFHERALPGVIFDGLTREEVETTFASLEVLVSEEAEGAADFTGERVRLVRYVGRKALAPEGAAVRAASEGAG